jgi:hypothetical protein
MGRWAITDEMNHWAIRAIAALERGEDLHVSPAEFAEMQRACVLEQRAVDLQWVQPRPAPPWAPVTGIRVVVDRPDQG